jgi:hypothetical protein
LLGALRLWLVHCSRYAGLHRPWHLQRRDAIPENSASSLFLLRGDSAPSLSLQAAEAKDRRPAGRAEPPALPGTANGVRGLIGPRSYVPLTGWWWCPVGAAPVRCVYSMPKAPPQAGYILYNPLVTACGGAQARIRLVHRQCPALSTTGGAVVSRQACCARRPPPHCTMSNDMHGVRH